MANAREVRLRIRSIKNISQVTRALQAVSASKVRKAMQAMMNTRPYATKAWQVLQHIAVQPSRDTLHPLLTKREEVNSVLVVLVTGDRGLAGAYNTNIVRFVLGHFAALPNIWSSWKTPAERSAAWSLLERVGLVDLAERRAGLLPLGNLRRLEIAGLGIGRTFQIVKPFAHLTVLENVLAARGIDRYRSLPDIWSSWKTPAERRASLSLLERVRLVDLAERRAGLLPLGNLRRLEIARELAVGRKLLLLDESFSGLRHEETAELEALIRAIRADGLTVLLIEHNMRVAMGLCDRLVVLDHGRKLAEGRPAEVRANEAVIEANLGRKGSAHAA